MVSIGLTACALLPLTFSPASQKTLFLEGQQPVHYYCQLSAQEALKTLFLYGPQPVTITVDFLPRKP